MSREFEFCCDMRTAKKLKAALHKGDFKKLTPAECSALEDLGARTPYAGSGVKALLREAVVPAPLLRRCPECAAKPRRPCKGIYGQVIRGFHPDRFRKRVSNGK